MESLLVNAAFATTTPKRSGMCIKIACSRFPTNGAGMRIRTALWIGCSGCEKKRTRAWICDLEVIPASVFDIPTVTHKSRLVKVAKPTWKVHLQHKCKAKDQKEHDMAKLTNDEKFEIIQKAQEARKRGDGEEADRILQQLPLAPHLAKSLKRQIGSTELLKAGFDLSEAEAAYGPNWLSE